MYSFVPVTYNIPFGYLGDELRRSFFNELALNGAKHVVLGAGLLPLLMSRPELPEMVASEMEETGLSFVDSHAPYGGHWDLAAPYEAEQPLKVLRLKLAIELAAFFKVRTMTLHLGKKGSCVSDGEYLDPIYKSLDELLPFAEEKKVILCIENGFAYRGFPQKILEIKERYPEDTLGFCFDAGHANMTTAPESFQGTVGRRTTSEEILEVMLPHIVNCHIHDNDGVNDKHDLPGRGCADWERIVAKLRTAPRLQVIQSEVNIASRGVAVRELVETFDKLFGKRGNFKSI